MTAMADTPLCLPVHEPQHAGFSTFRDLLLSLSLTVLAALAMEAAFTSLVLDPAGAVQDWNGNSGSLPSSP